MVAKEDQEKHAEESSKLSTNVHKHKAYTQSLIVHEGWLQKRTRKFPYKWHERYFTLRSDGVVIYYDDDITYHNAKPSDGKKVYATEWVNGTNNIVLKCSGEEEDMLLRMSTKSEGSVDDWIRNGNE